MAIFDIGDDLLEIFIDWKFSKEGLNQDDQMVSVLMDRGFITKNLITSGPKVMKREELDYALNQYLGDYLGEKKVKLEKILVEDFLKWNQAMIKKEFKK